MEVARLKEKWPAASLIVRWRKERYMGDRGESCPVRENKKTGSLFSRGPIAAAIAIVLTVGMAVAAATEELEKGGGVMTLIITSEAFQHNGAIPNDYTCDGRDISPPLEWTGLPAGTKSLALIVDDPDAPDPAAPKMTWVHWVLYNIPPTAVGLQEDVEPSALPDGVQEGTNDWRRTRYGGPCPPIGRHRYFHKLYALDTVLPDLNKPSKDKLLKAMEGHILSKAELVGTYERSR